MGNERDWYEHTGTVEAIDREELPSRDGGEPTQKVMVVLSASGYQGRAESVAFEFFGKAANNLGSLGLGETATVSFRPRSRKSQAGRWFTSCNAFGCKVQASTGRGEGW